MTNPNTYQSTFHTDPQATATAPGRVNLIGEHTDYNDGYVLPIAIPQLCTVAIGRSSDTQHHLFATDLDQHFDLALTDVPTGFAAYIVGCFRVLEEKTGITLPPLNVFVTSQVPVGAGLSSSAALEIATLRALRQLFAPLLSDIELSDIELAQLGQRAENVWAGVPCGILDQMASSIADEHHMLFLDTLTLETKRLPLPAGTEILVIDSRAPHNLTDGAYANLRLQCEAAARALGVPSLRHILEVSALHPLEGTVLFNRARHVVTEDNRVLACLEADAVHFGVLMNDSHISMREDFEITVEQTDVLVDLLQNSSGVYGARQTGGGFGGCVVALVELGEAQAIGQKVLTEYSSAGFEGRVVVP